MWTTLATMLQNEAMNDNNHSKNKSNNASWASGLLVRLLRRRPSVFGKPHDDGLTQEDLESCTTATIISCMEDHDDNDDDAMTNITTDHEEINNGDRKRQQHQASRITFNPHVVMVEFDKEEEGRQENIWIQNEEWDRIDMELQADVVRFHLAVFLPAPPPHEHSAGGEGDRDDKSQDGDDDDDGYQDDDMDEYCDCDDDLSYQDEHNEGTGKARTPDDFGAFRGLEHCLFPHRCQMRRRLVLRAVLSEQAQQHEHGNISVETMAEASQVWSRRDADRAREMAQADAHVVRKELLHEWKLQQQH